MEFEKVNDPGAANFGTEGAIVLGSAMGIAALLDGLLLMLALRLARRKGANIPRFGYWVCVFFGFVIAQVTATANSSLDLRVKALGRYIKDNNMLEGAR